jgi:HTH-type transcriptional regulator/antitoxin HipB
MIKPEIAESVRYFRKQSGLTQLALAKIAGVGKTSVYDIENGKESVQFDTLLKVLAVLNIQLKIITPFPQHNGK